MRALLPVLLVACGPPSTAEPPFALEVHFDTEIPTVARVTADVEPPLTITWTGGATGVRTGSPIVGLPQGEALTFEVVAQPGSGEVTLHSRTGAFEYLPNQDFVGSDSFVFEVTDAGGATSSPATLSRWISSSGEAWRTARSPR